MGLAAWTARSQSPARVPASPAAASLRISRSILSPLRRSASPGTPGGATARSASSTTADSDRAHSAPPAVKTSGKS